LPLVLNLKQLSPISTIREGSLFLFICRAMLRASNSIISLPRSSFSGLSACASVGRWPHSTMINIIHANFKISL